MRRIYDWWKGYPSPTRIPGRIKPGGGPYGRFVPDDPNIELAPGDHVIIRTDRHGFGEATVFRAGMLKSMLSRRPKLEVYRG